MTVSKIRFLLIACLFLSLFGCFGSVPSNQVLERGSNQSQLQKRNYQSRTFATNDKERAMRSVMSSLQDLEFVLEKADHVLGVVTGTKFVNNQTLKMTVNVREKGSADVLVRANAQYGLSPVENPQAYQDFFVSLSKAMFLDAQQLEDAR